MFTRKMVGEVHGRNRDLSGGCVLAAAAELLALGSSHVIQCDRSNDAVATCGNKRVTCSFPPSAMTVKESFVLIFF